MLRNEKVIDLACLVDINFDQHACLRKPQLPLFPAFIDEHVLELEVRLWDQPHPRTQLQTHARNVVIQMISCSTYCTKE